MIYRRSFHDYAVRERLHARRGLDVYKRQAQGYSYEVADGSLAVLLQWHLGTYRPHFTLESFRVIVDDHEDLSLIHI